MSDQSTLPPRPDEETLSELVWAHNPDIGSRPKQMTRGKLRILGPSGYREFVEAAEVPAEDAPPAEELSEENAPAEEPVNAPEAPTAGSVNRREKGQS